VATFPATNLPVAALLSGAVNPISRGVQLSEELRMAQQHEFLENTLLSERVIQLYRQRQAQAMSHIAGEVHVSSAGIPGNRFNGLGKGTQSGEGVDQSKIASHFPAPSTGSLVQNNGGFSVGSSGLICPKAQNNALNNPSA